MNWIDRWILRPRPWHSALLLGALALASRLAWVAVGGPSYKIVKGGGDAYTYDVFAQLMLSGWQWIWTPLARREPLYPVLMVLAHLFPGEVELPLQLIQALLGAGTVVLLYLGLVGQIRPAVAFFAGLLVALNPHFVFYTILGYRENLIIFLLAATLVALLQLAREDCRRTRFVLALVLTLLIHTDVRFLPLSLGLPGLLLVLHGWSWRPAMRQTAGVFAILVLLMLPYQIRGYLALGQPVIVTDKFLGQWLPLVNTRWQTEQPELSEEGTRVGWLEDWTAEKLAGFEKLRPSEQRLLDSGVRPTLSRVGTYRYHFADYWRFFKLQDDYRPYPDGRFSSRWSRGHNLSSLIAMLPFFLLAPFAWWRTPRAERGFVFALALLLGAHMAMHIAVHSLERYRVPMEVLTATLTAFGLVNLASVLLPGLFTLPHPRPTIKLPGLGRPAGAARSHSG